tara:strand:+ start:311 stop:1048 length:738 start_codon:yes stop_codon:yes gene_type:complete
MPKNIAIELENQFDVVISRHVVEHAIDPRKFLANLFKLVRKNGIVILETPDIEKVLVKRLARTIMLEHLNYFSLTSLNHLLTPKIIISNYATVCTASFIATMKTNHHKLEQVHTFNEASNLIEIAKSFTATFDADIEQLSKTINSWRQDHKKIWGWGAGRAASDIFSIYSQREKDFEGFIDSDIRKSSMRLPGAPNLPIVTPEIAKARGVDAVLITSFSVDEISKDIANRGWDVDISDIYCARSL